MTVEIDDGERGAPVERTVLAWNRAGIAVAANGALLARVAFVHDLIAVEVVGLAVTFVGIGIWALSLARYSAVGEAHVPHLFGRDRRAPALLGVLVLLLSLVDVLVIAYLR
jgi:uncharacterized membrane protein YidH (DUF202 family)